MDMMMTKDDRLLPKGKKFCGGGLQTALDAAPSRCATRGDPTVPSAKLGSVTKKATAPHLGSSAWLRGGKRQLQLGSFVRWLSFQLLRRLAS